MKNRSKKKIKCPNCGNEMIPVDSWIEHPGPGGKMIGHPGPISHYECKRCGTKRKRLKTNNCLSWALEVR